MPKQNKEISNQWNILIHNPLSTKELPPPKWKNISFNLQQNIESEQTLIEVCSLWINGHFTSRRPKGCSRFVGSYTLPSEVAPRKGYCWHIVNPIEATVNSLFPLSCWYCMYATTAVGSCFTPHSIAVGRKTVSVITVLILEHQV